MKIEQQVVSLELAKRLKELGVKQETYFYWVEFGGGYAKDHRDYDKYKRWELRTIDKTINFPERISAYTVAELGEILPPQIRVDNKLCSIFSFKEIDSYNCIYIDYDRTTEKLFRTDTEANARALMLIHLIEFKHIKVNA